MHSPCIPHAFPAPMPGPGCRGGAMPSLLRSLPMSNDRPRAVKASATLPPHLGSPRCEAWSVACGAACCVAYTPCGPPPPPVPPSPSCAPLLCHHDPRHAGLPDAGNGTQGGDEEIRPQRPGLWQASAPHHTAQPCSPAMCPLTCAITPCHVPPTCPLQP